MSIKTYRVAGLSALVILLSLFSAHAQAALKADNFVLIDHKGKSHELYYHRDDKAVVIVSQGNAQVLVGKDPMVAIISTGDELIDPGKEIAAHQIRRSNPYTIGAELNQQGFFNTKLFHLPDNPDKMDEVLENILAEYDLQALSNRAARFTPSPITV